jgi:ABC-type branched-subunit amino acid transport system permease subunit
MTIKVPVMCLLGGAGTVFGPVGGRLHPARRILLGQFP